MNSIKKMMLLIGLGVVISAGTQAAPNLTPESGWWLDPDTPGRGYNIEIQDNIVFIAAFTYDPLETEGVRRPIWFQTAGALKGENGDNILEAEFLLYEDGTCIGCSKTQNAIHPTEKHELRIEFDSNTTGTMAINGESFPIQRFHFAPSYAAPATRALGQWHLIINAPTSFPLSSFNPIAGDVLVLEDIGADGDIDGCAVTDVLKTFCEDTDEIVLARYHPDFDQLVIAVFKGTDVRRYVLFPETEKMAGVVDQYRSTDGSFNLDRAGTVYAYRSSSKAFVQTGKGPAKASHSVQNAENNIRDVLREHLSPEPDRTSDANQVANP